MKKNKDDSKMYYGLLIFIVLVIGCFGIIYLLFHKQPELPKHEYVCNHLEKQSGNFTIIYPEVINIRNYIQRHWTFLVPYIDGTNTKARQWDNDGVMCEVSAEMCDADFYYCLDMRIIVPVNYTKWEIWRKYGE